MRKREKNYILIANWNVKFSLIKSRVLMSFEVKKLLIWILMCAIWHINKIQLKFVTSISYLTEYITKL